MEKEVKTPKKKTSIGKNIFRVSIVLIAILAAIGAFFGVKALIEKAKREADIKVGDTTIKYSQIKKVQDEAEKYKKDNPAAAVDAEYARNAVIFNSAIKSYAKEKCGLSELYDYDELKEFAGDSWSNSDSTSFEYISKENQLYKAKMKSCMIKKREVLTAFVSYETPYMSKGSKEEINAKYESAKEKLANDFLPLFNSSATTDEIAAKADVNLIADPYASDFDFSRLENGIVSMVKKTTFDRVEGVSGGNYIDSGAAGDLTEAQDSIAVDAKLSGMKVGDHTEIIMNKNGIFAIYRIESVNDAEFYTWDEFLEITKKNNSITERVAYNESNVVKAAKTLNGEVCYAVAGNTWTCQYTGGSTMRKPGFYMHDSHPDGDFRHVKAIRFRIVDTSGAPVNGVTVNSSAPYVETRDATSWVSWNGLNYTVPPYNWVRWGAFEGNGYAFGMGDCNTSGTLTTTMTAPSGYVFTDNGQRTITVRNPIAGSNDDGVTDRQYTIRRDVQPPADKPDSPRQSSSVKTQVRLNNTGNWQNGTIVAPVGSTVNFKHTINGNFNSNWSNYFIDWQESNGQVSNRNVNRSGISLGSNASGDVVVQGDTTGLKNNVGVTPIKITHADVGKTICENMNYTWRLEYYYQKGNVRNGAQVHDRMRDASRDQRGSGSSSQACVYVPYNYELTPCINGSGSMCGGVDIPGEPGETIPNTPEVNNPNGNTPSRPDTRWIITTWTISGNYESQKTPNSPINNSNGNTCSVYSTAYGAPLVGCRASETGTRSFPPNGKTGLGLREISIPENAPLGSRYCIALSVSPYKLEANESQTTQNQKVGTQWRHSAPFCLKATKKPKLQVWGNGIYSRGGIITSRSNIKGGVFGSWVEYEAIAGGKVNGFTSESSNTGNRLTFANDKSGTKGNWGNWTGATETNRIISNIKGRYPRSRDGVVRETRNGIYGGHDGNTTPNIHTRIIDSNGMFLTGNITSRSPLGTDRIRAFQQTIIIVDGDLYISKDVTKIDAWLIVKGKIVTCATEQRENSAIVNNNNCGKTLQVNGPIIANNLKSWRTGGSEFSNPGSPSETYNQRADVYLWAYAQGTSSNKVVTTYTKEVPVRY